MHRHIHFYTPPEGRPNYTKVETRLLEKGYKPPIHDFAINSEKEGDITQEILNEPKVALLIMYNLNNTENRGMLKLPQIIKRAKTSGYRVIALSSSAPKEADQAKSTYGLDVNFYTTDGTALKTVIRSNPGVVLLKNGVVTAKSHWNDFEEMDL